MSKRLFTAASALSLVLLIATPVLWPRCGLRGQHWIYVHETRGAGGQLVQHNLVLTVTAGASPSWDADDWNTWSWRELQLPCWLLAAASVPMPAFWLARWNRKRRAAALGLCPVCGYDLRATPQRCPECGRIPE